MPRKTDSEVEQWVLRELSISKKVCSSEICVLVRDGVVRLRGSAQTDRDKSAIDEAVRRATGVVGVVNEMRVKPCTALIEKVFARVPRSAAARPDTLVHRTATHHSVAKAAMR
jgi:BON domain